MKIAFLCGSLEPGRDGVGDYTRRLAGELIRQNKHVIIIALYDTYVTEVFTGTQDTEYTTVNVFRLPSILSLADRFKQAKIWINEFEPDWLSLQFVSFGFHSRGLPFGLSKWLKRLGNGRPWHVMFHELWVGMDVSSSIKLFLWGSLQQKLIQGLLVKLSPAFVHTQAQLYQLQLAKLGIISSLLPLFSNIPLINLGKSNIDDNQPRQIKLVLFGSIHPKAPINEFAQEAACFTKRHKILLSLTIIGRTGAEQNQWANAWKSVGLPVELLGEQSTERISAVLQNASFGIATTAFLLTDKSGSVAAMHEHGLPVICVANYWYPRDTDKIPVYFPGTLEYQYGNLEKILTSDIKCKLTESTLISVVNQLTYDLNSVYECSLQKKLPN